MQPRFYVPGEHAPGDLIPLPEDEADHATRVLRLGAGATIRIFNGAGREHGALITAASKKGVQVEVGPDVTPAAEPAVSITLVQAILKGDKMDDVVRDAVMLGVAAIQPVVTARSETSLAAIERGARLARWQRVAVSSIKQCGRAVVPAIARPAVLESSLISRPGALAVMCVEPVAAGGRSISTLPRVAPAAVRVVIGPEGGWTPEEVAMGAAAASLITLGARTLRADAMPLVALSALYAYWEEF